MHVRAYIENETVCIYVNYKKGLCKKIHKINISSRNYIIIINNIIIKSNGMNTDVESILQV